MSLLATGSTTACKPLATQDAPPSEAVVHEAEPTPPRDALRETEPPRSDRAPDDTNVRPDRSSWDGVASLPGTLVIAKPGLRGVDAYSTISAKAARAMVDEGYAFAARYVRYSSKSTANHITRTEAEAILDAGLALFLVQLGRGWHQTVPTAEMGRRDGELAVEEATALGYPLGAIIFVDVEGVTAKATKAEDLIAFVTAWHDAVKGSYVPGYYVGPAGELNADQLGALPFEHFWKSGAKVQTPTGRGYQLTQHRYSERGRNVVAGVGIDYDITQDDLRGEAIPWLAPPSAG